MKKCNCGCGYPVFSNGYASYCQWKRTDKKRPKPIPQVSKKESKRLAKYYKAKSEYMAEHELCEVCQENKADQIHHRKGRIGSLLWDKSYFLASCDTCHRRVELNPEWAKDNGYSLNRL
jgi:hypothetical protein